ncbi:YciI family protein [Prosthecobacter sp. SYSU 5D2]|uniref:YciI family protein n=1 Tax=Prosthecobacter sp. SYSU 5D2 TaxID=3134134 RepID=UPI0031FEE484
MKVMVLVKATKNSEDGILPSMELMAEMGRFNEELVAAGVLLDGDGLKPSRQGKRVRFSGGKQTVMAGPFSQTNELVAGFWIWQVKSMEEALEWMKRCPVPMPGEDCEVELRPFYEMEDFGPEMAQELREQEERLRREVEKRIQNDE